MCKQFLESFAQQCEGLTHLSTGVAASCRDCQDVYGMTESEILAAQESDDLCEDPHFSWHACDTCGSIAGDRYEGHADSDGELIHLNICGDCLCYIANGDVPKHWED